MDINNKLAEEIFSNLDDKIISIKSMLIKMSREMDKFESDYYGGLISIEDLKKWYNENNDNCSVKSKTDKNKLIDIKFYGYNIL